MKVYSFDELPEELQSIFTRALRGEIVYGFEFELLADYVSQ